MNKSRIRSLILDMDGVLWRDSEAIGNLPQIFERIKQGSLGVVLATNNASRTPNEHLQKIFSFGVRGLESWQVVTSVEATVDFLHEQYPMGGKIFVVGEEAMINMLHQAGFSNSDDEGIIAVVVGIDRQLTYQKLSKATLLIRAGAAFIGTNPDSSFPTPYGLVPGAGAIQAAIQVASDVAPIIVGKPSPAMYKIAMKRLCTQPCETLVVGDRPETDIAGAQAIGCPTALVLSGVTSATQAAQWQPSPDYILEDLNSVLDVVLGQ